ncbi:unnamed protein product [Owenia fusiformis]|uniref:Uncharacterized protein n=1 Tax=Owenia fusiformis TaxID=6347 RepID=A0A8S4N1J3_OWEFU|nr:unnamed protein product [Owenia fusiformis]
MHVYNMSLGLFALRMVAFFLYDTSLVAKSINKMGSTSNADGYTTTGPPEEIGVKGWESILLVFSCAFRGSLARFYFSKLFQGVLLPKVCDNVPVKVGDRILGARDQQGGRQHTVPWLTPGEEDRLLASSHHGYDQTQISSDTNEAQTIFIPPNLCERELGDMVVVTHDNTQQRHLYGSLSEHGDKLQKNIHSDTNKHQPLYIPQNKRVYVDMGVQYNSEIANGHDSGEDIAVGHDGDKDSATAHGCNKDIVTGHDDEL